MAHNKFYTWIRSSFVSLGNALIAISIWSIMVYLKEPYYLSSYVFSISLFFSRLLINAQLSRRLYHPLKSTVYQLISNNHGKSQSQVYVQLFIARSKRHFVLANRNLVTTLIRFVWVTIACKKNYLCHSSNLSFQHDLNKFSVPPVRLQENIRGL